MSNQIAVAPSATIQDANWVESLVARVAPILLWAGESFVNQGKNEAWLGKSREAPMRLRSRINPEEQHNLVEGPTRYRKDPNEFELVCEFCGDTYYVDEETYRQTLTAMEKGIDNPFCCDECESGYEELSY